MTHLHESFKRKPAGGGRGPAMADGEAEVRATLRRVRELLDRLPGVLARARALLARARVAARDHEAMEERVNSEEEREALRQANARLTERIRELKGQLKDAMGAWEAPPAAKRVRPT